MGSLIIVGIPHHLVASAASCLAAAENRLEDKDVRQMHAALKRVVQDEHVARLDLAGDGLSDCRHRRRHRAEMAG
jgi:hypothetical protein